MEAPMRRSAQRRGTSRLSKAWRVVVVTVLLGAALSVGSTTVSPPPAGAAHEACRTSAIDVTLNNKSGSQLSFYSEKHGLTNEWCSRPGLPVAPRSRTNFEVGDNIFATTVNVQYVAPNLDSISLQASSGYADIESPQARCLVIPNGNTPAQYQCSAKVRVEVLDRGALFGLGTRVTFVDWEVTGP
jgi:hypothetical protein